MSGFEALVTLSSFVAKNSHLNCVNFVLHHGLDGRGHLLHHGVAIHLGNLGAGTVKFLKESRTKEAEKNNVLGRSHFP